MVTKRMRHKGALKSREPGSDTRQMFLIEGCTVAGVDIPISRKKWCLQCVTEDAGCLQRKI